MHLRARPTLLAFARDPRGFTGAERALLLCSALAVVSLCGYLVGQGSSAAAADAARTLRTQTGGGAFRVAGTVQPLQAGEHPRTAAPAQAARPSFLALAGFSSDFQGAPAAFQPAASLVGRTATVQPGDSLSAIAQRELGDASRWPEIFQLNQDVIGGDPGQIQPGMVLRLPDGGAPPAPEGVGDNAAQVARLFLGQTEYQLQSSGKLPMDSWVPKDVDCANFVSSCLEKAGLITHAQRSNAVVQLADNLRAAGWKDVPLSSARPGDVVSFDGPAGNYQHVELFDSWVNGQPQYIGSNNILPDGTQAISYDDGKWAYQVHVLTPP